MPSNMPSLSHLSEPLLGFRFSVSFLGTNGVDFPEDFLFQSVSGLTVEVQTGQLSEGDTSISSRSYPTSLSYGNLILKRGMPKKSDLRTELENSFDTFQFHPRNVLVSILDETGSPIKTWVFEEAYPVKWSLSDLDATSSSVILEEVQLAYTQFKSISL